jgi:hypothetical protein
MMETTREITFLTYNVWSREDMVVRLRMEAIGELVRRHKPDVIFFQVTFRKQKKPFHTFTASTVVHTRWVCDFCYFEIVQEVTPHILRIFRSHSWWAPVEEAVATGHHFCLMVRITS